MIRVGVVAAFLALLLAVAPVCGLAKADVLVIIDKAHQRMSVKVNGWSRYTWPISTARRGYVTPSGVYRPIRLERTWFSTKYHNSPMPYSIFFKGGYAIHGSYEIKYLGRPASHGCVRLHPDNAAILFSLIKQQGKNKTRIEVH